MSKDELIIIKWLLNILGRDNNKYILIATIHKYEPGLFNPLDTMIAIKNIAIIPISAKIFS
jgi:hypothetical protein